MSPRTALRKVWHVILAFTWGVRSVRIARTKLRAGALAVMLPAPPAISVTGVRGVRLAARVLRASCLERSLVLQRWYLQQGREIDVLIGVARDGDATLAHAWLEGEEWRNGRAYVEMTRVPAR